MEQSSEKPRSIRIAIKAGNGKYVSVSEGADLFLLAESTTIGNRETFEMTYLGDRRVSLKAFHGKYVGNEQVDPQSLIANQMTVGSWETFEMINQSGNQVVLKSYNGKYVRTKEAKGFPLQANGSQTGPTETFTLIALSQEGEVLAKQALGKGKAEEDEEAEYTLEAGSPATLSSDPYTVCFCGTGCTRDEGEKTRKGSNKGIYCKETGYIPVRIHQEISGDLRVTSPSVTVRGAGENDWYNSGKTSESLMLDGPLKAPKNLLDYVTKYTGGNQKSSISEFLGKAAVALALHGANLAASSGARQYNFIGHSRGGMECIMAAWFLYFYGRKDIPVNIFAIDPVPGPGEWYGIFTNLPPNVVNYAGVYAWDQCIQASEDKFFMGLVPRPNGRMINKPNDVKRYDAWWWDNWRYIADNCNLPDPLKASTQKQPKGYEIYACRGRHSTVAGNTTGDGYYDPANISACVSPVPKVVYKLARAYLAKWGTSFKAKSNVSENIQELRRKIHTDHREFDAMGEGATRTSVFPLRPYVRRLSSIPGRLNFYDNYYMDNVVGDPPYKLSYPVTIERESAGWVKWKFL